MISVATQKSLGFGQGGNCFLYASAKVAPTTADWAEYIAWFTRVLAAAGGPPMVSGALTVLVYERASGPNAAQRKQLNDLVARYPIRVAVVTNSAIARGVLTAMSWFAKGKGYQPFTPEQLDSAMEFLQVDMITASSVKQNLLDLLRQLDGEKP